MYSNPKSQPKQFYEPLRREFVQAFIVKVLHTAANPVTGAKLGDRMQGELIKFFDELTKLASHDAYSYTDDDLSQVVEVKAAEVRMSWEMIAERTGRSIPTVKRHMAIFEAMGFSIRRYEKKKLSWSMKAMKNIAKSGNEWKIITLNLDRMEEYYERLSIDRELELVNASEYIPGYEESYEEAFVSEETRLISQEEANELASFQNETGLGNYEPHVLALATGDNQELSSENADSAVQILLPKENPALGENTELGVTPPLGDEWSIEVADGGVNRDRQVRTFAEIPTKPRGEFYATWVGERVGAYWTPWVIWDMDFPTIEEAWERTKKFVSRLRVAKVPDEAIRVVCSTNKGFHVYLDSRCLDMKPSKNLHLQLREFCMRIVPECDKSLYDKRRVLGVPNSKHRSTGWYYAEIPLGVLFGTLAEIKMRTAIQHPVTVRPEAMEPVPMLAAEWQKSLSRATPKTGWPSFDRMKARIEQPLPEYFGVGEGERDRAAFRMASYYQRRGLTKPEVLDLCLIVNSRNKPPLPERDIRAKVERVFDKNSRAVENL